MSGSDLDRWVQVALGLHAVSIIIVNITPTPRDDEALRRAYRVLEIFAGLVFPSAKR